MKYVWEDKDIRHGTWAGRVVCDRLEMVCITYSRGLQRYGLCAFGTDGATYFPEDAIESLTRGSWRPLDKEKILQHILGECYDA